MFFLSSPPQPPPTQFQPQYFGASNNPFAFQQHAPLTPSPLRTSYNANHGLRRPRLCGSMSKNDQQTNYGVENKAFSLSSPISRGIQEEDFENLPETAQENTAHPSEHLKPFSFSSPTPTASTTFFTPSTTAGPTTAVTAPTSRYEARSRASTPNSLLQNHATTRRADTRAKFLDRIRTRRDEGFGRDDKLLRADYLEERRAWETEMRLLDNGAGVEVEEEEELDENMAMSGVVADAESGVPGKGVGEEEGQMSPTEEKEIEELLELWDGEGNGFADQADGDGDSQEWDEVFMEVLSQEQQHQQPQTAAQDPRTGPDGEAVGDTDMDLS
ncbi:uncharacterized protein AB675_4407 [Cyphellophora attinorum]|uniref:Uncharacterized protein n=1 Tax=Cyphellophora attinorum TaxID=1664694 RepID=A0A0N1GZH0_9EURO|nr:uncharacterized protein AB675_4407 [Phialophora attinorum]KPI36577.1 hypothetical protein AB675_4407 [Phialophora attinorum]